MTAVGYTLLLGLYLAGANVFASNLSFESGPGQTVMIELYTSEGCSSCPPAERFLNQLVDDPRLWQTYFPMAFHVDYWDYLGWRDAFAKPAFSRRQSRYSQYLGTATVYTPEFFVNGREWRRGVFAALPKPSGNKVGTLRAVLNGAMLQAEFAPHTRPLLLHVAVLGMDLHRDIGAGENAGRRLTHQFVVLASSQQRSETGRWHIPLPKPDAAQSDSRKALLLWVSDEHDPRPLQATGGYLPH